MIDRNKLGSDGLPRHGYEETDWRPGMAIRNPPEMIEKLPYQLTEGVTATEYGLVFDGVALIAKLVTGLPTISGGIMPWPEAAGRLRYQDGEPWCKPMLDQFNAIECVGTDRKPAYTTSALHRLAAILCDDAEAFRVLYWCVHNLGEE